MHANDNGTDDQTPSCSRSGIDRRQFSYSYYIPERRSGKDRRREYDRRAGIRPTQSKRAPKEITGTP